MSRSAPAPKKSPDSAASKKASEGKKADNGDSASPRIPERGHASLDHASRPGPGEKRGDAEHPRAPLDSESQGGGRSMEEELFLDADADDAGGLPHQLAENRGRRPQDDSNDASLPNRLGQ